MYYIPTIRTNLIDECCQHSLALLRRNSVDAGILAASPGPLASGRNYTSIFGRDASLCAIGMATTALPDMVAIGSAGLRTLARYQADNGQIPKFVRPQNGERDFWYTGCIDATLWWLIAVRLFDRLVPGTDLERELGFTVNRALEWLKCQEHPVWRLLQQNEASDWADIMPRSGFVLYSNALWYWVKRLYHLPGIDLTAQFARQMLSPFGSPRPEHPRAALMVDHIVRESPPTPFFLSFVNFSFWGEEIDVFGNLLAALTGLADAEKRGEIIEGLLKLDANRPYPIRVVGVPMEPGHHLWRRYMERHGQNLPFCYHNGGIWSFIGCFWVLLLARHGMQEEARQELERLAELNRLNSWDFNEWFHGRTGQPMGMPGQSWNAAMFLLAVASLERNLPLF